MKSVGVLLFADFETLDVFGPVEILGRLTDYYSVSFYSQNGGIVSNAHGVYIETFKLSEIAKGVDVFIIPGGWGTRKEVGNVALIEQIGQIAKWSSFVLTVCTGSVLLARTGLLDGRMATSNKRAFDWAISSSDRVRWQRKARWTVDGKFYTSSGVSAGMDMAFGFLSDIHGVEFARQAASQIEYSWQEDREIDNFCKLYVR
jgi:Transcriptional regulator containing an amidase domain and an AraC-type DNA-binding HTH domain